MRVTGALSGSTTTFGYDGYGRLNSVTDSEGYHVTATYDVANRPVQLTYPAGLAARLADPTFWGTTLVVVLGVGVLQQFLALLGYAFGVWALGDKDK